MAIVQTGASQLFSFSSTAQTGDVSTTITVPADAEIVIGGVSRYIDSGGGMSSMTFTKGGSQVAMTKVTGGDASSSSWTSAMFYLALPDTGSNKTWSWSWSVAPSDSAGLYSLTFWKGIDTASPVRSSNGVQNAGGFPITTSTLTAQSGDLIVAFLGAFVGSGTGSVDSWTNLTLLENLAQGAHADGAWATGSPSGNTTVSAASATDMAEPSLSALVLKSASAGTFTPRSMLLGVG